MVWLAVFLSLVQQSAEMQQHLAEPKPNTLHSADTTAFDETAFDEAAADTDFLNSNHLPTDAIVLLQDITRDMYQRAHRRNRAAQMPPSQRRMFVRDNVLIQSPVVGASAGVGGRGASHPADPNVPTHPTQPAVPLFLEKILGHQFAMMSAGIESAFSRREKRAMEGQFVPYYYDPNGNQDGSGGGFDDPLGQLPTETNLCFALLENWLRSCSEPQLMLEISSTTTEFDPSEAAQPVDSALTAAASEQGTGTGVGAAQSMRFDVAQFPAWMIPNTTADLQRMAEREDVKQWREILLQDTTLIPTIFSNKSYVGVLSECAQHPILSWYHLSQPVGQNLLGTIDTFLHQHPELHPPVATGGTKPAAPDGLMTILTLFGVLATIVSGLMSVLGTMASGLQGAQTQNTQIPQNDIMNDIWNMFRADKGPPGVRAGFAQPEMYDARGPYGPEPFPFQTPGAEKCHRFLTSYVWKCAVS